MLIKRRRVNQKPRSDEFLVLIMIPKNVADILAEVTLDAFAKFLHAVDVFLLHSPGAILGIGSPRFEFLDTFLDLLIPRNVRYQIFDRRKGSHWLYRHGLVERDRIKARHTHQLRHTVDLGGAGTALPCFAIPTARKVTRLFTLNLKHGIEHDHTFRNLGLVINHLTARRPTASYAKSGFRH